MTFSEFQNRSMFTAIYPAERGLEYAVLGLTNEAGEVAGKLKKHYRDGTSIEDARAAIKSELFDVLWYCAAVAKETGGSLEIIVQEGLAKLADRQQRGVLQGSGDNR